MLVGGLPAVISALQENPNHPHTLAGGKGDDLFDPGPVCGAGGGWVASNVYSVAEQQGVMGYYYTAKTVL